MKIQDFVLLKVTQLSVVSPWSRAMLARLRRGLGKAPGDVPDIWEITLGGAPEDWLSHDGQPSREEKAVHLALTLYAAHQQGQEKVSMNKSGPSLGAAVGALHAGASSAQAVKRRFDQVATATGWAELTHHARGIIQLLKAKDIPLDYPLLARDLYVFQLPEGAGRVRLRWGEDFYQMQPNIRKDSAEKGVENEKALR